MASPRPFLYPGLDERLLLVEHLAEFSDQPILIKGPEGSGKSRVARYLADPDRHPHWMPVLIDGAMRPNRGDLLPILYEALDVGSLPPGGAQAQLEAAMSALRQRLAYLRHIRQTPLLVLDDAQLIPPDTLEFLTLLAATGGARLCLFSETPLQLSLDPDREPGQTHQLDLPPLAPQDLIGFAEYLQETGQLTAPSIDLGAAPPDRLLALHKSTGGRPAALIEALQSETSEKRSQTSGTARAPRPGAAVRQWLRDLLPARKIQPATIQAPAAPDAGGFAEPIADETETLWFDTPAPAGRMDDAGASRDKGIGLSAADLAARFEPAFDDSDFEPEVALSGDTPQSAAAQSTRARSPVGPLGRFLDIRWVGGLVAVVVVIATAWWLNRPTDPTESQTLAAADSARAADTQATDSNNWATKRENSRASIETDGSVLLPLPAADASRLPTITPSELKAPGLAAGLAPGEVASAEANPSQDVASRAADTGAGATDNALFLPIEPATPASTEARGTEIPPRTADQAQATAASSNADEAVLAQNFELDLPLPEFTPDRPGIARPQSATLARPGAAASGQSNAPSNEATKGAASQFANASPNTPVSTPVGTQSAASKDPDPPQGTADIPSAFRNGNPVEPPGGWFIQLLGSRDPATIDRFVARPDLPKPVFVARTRYRDGPWFIVLIGGIEDRATANSILAKLPDSLKKTNPWPRTGASLEDAELRATAP